MIRIVFTGGGSGGHVYPLLAVAEAIRKTAIEKKIEAELYYLGPVDAWSDILRTSGVVMKSLIAGKIRRYAALQNFFDIPKFFAGFLQAIFKLFWLMPDAIFSKGGTGALPVVLAGWFYRIPIVIHESDATPGLANLASSRFADRIAAGFESAVKFFHPQRTAWTGNPIRRDLLQGQPEEGNAKIMLGFDSKKPLLLVLGGSQGAQRINEFIMLSLKDLAKEAQILHQTGAANLRDVEQLAKVALSDAPLTEEASSRYKAVPYLEADMKTALGAADIVVARAGASTISEIAAFGKPAILIPIEESAQNHQKLNAYAFAEAGAAVVIEEENLLPGVFLAQTRGLLKRPEQLAAMRRAAKKFFKPDAAETIAEEIFRLAGA